MNLDIRSTSDFGIRGPSATIVWYQKALVLNQRKPSIDIVRELFNSPR
jgi:hypothetical protein